MIQTVVSVQWFVIVQWFRLLLLYNDSDCCYCTMIHTVVIVQWFRLLLLYNDSDCCYCTMIQTVVIVQEFSTMTLELPLPSISLGFSGGSHVMASSVASGDIHGDSPTFTLTSCIRGLTNRKLPWTKRPKTQNLFNKEIYPFISLDIYIISLDIHLFSLDIHLFP